MKNIIINLLIFFVVSNTFAQRVSFAEFEQMKINNVLSLNQLMNADSPHQFVEQALNIVFNVECDKQIVGTFCYYTKNGLQIHTWDNELYLFKISNPFYTLNFGSKVIKIGDSKSKVLACFANAPADEKLYADDKEGTTYIFLSWYVGGATNTYLNFYFDTQTKKLVKFGLIDD